MSTVEYTEHGKITWYDTLDDVKDAEDFLNELKTNISNGTETYVYVVGNLLDGNLVAYHSIHLSESEAMKACEEAGSDNHKVVKSKLYL